MATKKELGVGYFGRLSTSKNPVQEFEKILSEINSLTYDNSNRPISNIDKAEIIEIIIEKLETFYSEFSSFTGPEKIFEHEEIVKAFSNDNYLDLINYIKNRIKK